MPRSRLIFLVIIGAAILIVVAATLLQSTQKNQEVAEATRVAEATLTAVGVPNANNNTTIVPVFANGQVPTDNLPKYVCAADAFASYYGLQQMQVAGYDVQNGFHLGIVPFYLDVPDKSFDIDESGRTSLLQNGQIDCLFTTL